MSKLVKPRLLLLLAVSLILSENLFAQPAKAKTEDGIRGNLVDTSWLAKHLKDAKLVLLDASSFPKYAKQHIAGAQNVQIYDLISYGFGGFSPQQTEELFQSLGVSLGKKIVVYDEGGSNVATTLFFALYRNGFPASDLYYLDGGLAKWQANGLPVTTETATQPAKGTFKVKPVDARVELPDVITATGDTQHYAVVEGLTPDWHYGEMTMLAKSGHIPNSILAPDVDFFNADKTFKSPAEIRQMLTYLHVRPDQQIYTYCGGGVAATVPYFAAKFIANYPKVKVFQESEMGWISDPRELPFWTYDQPYLMRDAQWLRFWGGQMLRSFMAPRVSVIDVRPENAYKQGHIAYSVNVPEETFRSRIAMPEKLAQVLGPDGVSASQEAVIVSGGGITKEAALAYVLLEKLGQSKVSILMSSSETWAKNGLMVTKEATVLGPKKSPRDLAVIPTTYTSELRKGIVIADEKSTKGIYPKVFIVSGKEMPSGQQKLEHEGKVIHVPYMELLNADGTPKAAKDIWEILSKAGLTRYAEIICVSDDPAEAAANYFILNLMGFADIKMLGA